MSEYNKQRYYWIKLTDRFMTSDAVDFLMEQKNGAQYVVLYQMLCLKTVNNNGELARTIGEIIIPYDAEKIQRDLKYFSIDTVRVALELFKKLGLIYEQDNGSLRITNFENLIGSQTFSAENKQIQRRQAGGQMSTQLSSKCPPDKDKDKDKDKEIDIDIEDERKKESYKNIDPSNAREIFAQMTDEELLSWGNDPETRNNPYFYSLIEFHYNESCRRAATLKRWKGKTVAEGGLLKVLVSHEDLMDEYNVTGAYREKVKEFLKACYANGHIVINSKLDSILFELTDNYSTDEERIVVLNDAINGGYNDIRRLK